MIELGYIALVLAFIVVAYGAVASLLGARTHLAELVASGRNATYAAAALVLLAGLLLWKAILTDQFQFEYVVTHTERAMPLFYKISALWGGQNGSLLFWTMLLALLAASATWFFRGQQEGLKPYVNAVLLINLFFFLAIVLFAANPFVRLWRVGGDITTSVFQPPNSTLFFPNDGQGLNPQLQNYWMVIHPVTLYIGFIGMTVPFAFAVAALVTGQLGNGWIQLIRKWTLIPWIFLTVGILLGSQWAYVELGWGGYWAWDPVENASLLPWLTATAFIHSIMIQERRGMLKVWNMLLIWLTWELTLIGTFLTRSGVIQSVHSFALSPVGPMFAVFIFLSLIGFLALLVWRLPMLQSENQLDGIASRETSFLTQNVVFLVIMFATLLGTLFQPLSEWVTGNKIALNAPYFQRVNAPLFLVLLALMGIAPLLAWRRSGTRLLMQNFAIPILAGALSIPATALLGNRSIPGFIAFAVITFVAGGIVQEYVRGIQVRRRAGENVAQALVGLVSRNGRRYGGYVVHLGVLMVALGIIGNEFYQSQGQGNLRPGESLTIANYTLTYRSVIPVQGPNYVEYSGVMDLSRNGVPLGQILPKKVLYNKYPDQPMTEVGLRPGAMEDVYVVMAGFESGGATASFKAYVNPLMSWMWVGGLVMMLGVLLSAWPRRDPALVPAGALATTQRVLAAKEA